MTRPTTHIGRTVRRTTLLAIPLLVAATGAAAAHSGVGHHGSMSGGGGWGLFSGSMVLWGLLWLVILLGVPFLVVYGLRDREGNGSDDGTASILRERYARGELSDDEFEHRREQLEQSK